MPLAKGATLDWDGGTEHHDTMNDPPMRPCLKGLGVSASGTARTRTLGRISMIRRGEIQEHL